MLKNKPLGNGIMRLIRFGKGQRLSNVAAYTLTQGVVPAFHMRSLPSFLPNTMMGFPWEHVVIGRPKITEGMAVFVCMRDGLPESKTGRFASVSNGKGDDLAGSAAYRRPQPSCLVFFAHKTPNFIEFEHIIWGRRQKGFFDIRQVLDVRFEPPCNGWPCHRKDPCHSTQATAFQTSPQHCLLLGF